MKCPKCGNPLDSKFYTCNWNNCNYSFVDPPLRNSQNRRIIYAFNEDLIKRRLNSLKKLEILPNNYTLRQLIWVLPDNCFEYGLFNSINLKSIYFPAGEISFISLELKKRYYLNLLEFDLLNENVFKKFSWPVTWMLEINKMQMFSEERFEFYSDKYVAFDKNYITKEFYGIAISNYSNNEKIYRCWIKHLEINKEYKLIITESLKAIEKFTSNDSIKYYYTAIIKADLLISEDNCDYLALHYLALLKKKNLWSNLEHDSLYFKAVEKYLPNQLKLGRGVPTNILGDFWRAIKLTGIKLGSTFGGKDSTVPYDLSVLKSVPEFLSIDKVKDYLEKDKNINVELETLLKKNAYFEPLLFGSVPLAGQIWSLSLIDNNVLNAISFSYEQHPDTLMGFKKIAEILQENSGNHIEGALNRLHGYVAEQQVAFDLAQSGHNVMLPNTPNNPGYDLLVDGHMVQVKNTLNPEIIHEHFIHYPDIPVITNSEMASHFTNNNMVHIDQSLSYNDVVHHTSATMDGLDGIGHVDVHDLLPIPLLAIGFSIYRNHKRLDNGLTIEEFSKIVGKDAAFRGIAGFGGAKIGSLVGSIVGPIGTIIGSIMGGVIGGIAGGTGSNAVINAKICEARDKVVTALYEYALWYKDNLLSNRIKFLQERDNYINHWTINNSENSNLRQFSHILQIASNEAFNRATKIMEFIEKGTNENAGDFLHAHAGWVAVMRSQTFFHPKLTEKLKKIEDQIQIFKETQKSN